MTSLADFVQHLANLPISSVVRRFVAPPPALSSADLPASWTQIPLGEADIISFRPAELTWPRLKAELVVALQPVAQDIQEENYLSALAMADAVAVALQNADICRGPLRWSLRIGIVAVAEIQYWAVIAIVEGTG